LGWGLDYKTIFKPRINELAHHLGRSAEAACLGAEFLVRLHWDSHGEENSFLVHGLQS
jgi:hypothetical protein